MLRKTSRTRLNTSSNAARPYGLVPALDVQGLEHSFESRRKQTCCPLWRTGHLWWTAVEIPVVLAA